MSYYTQWYEHWIHFMSRTRQVSHRESEWQTVCVCICVRSLRNCNNKKIWNVLPFFSPLSLFTHSVSQFVKSINASVSFQELKEEIKCAAASIRERWWSSTNTFSLNSILIVGQCATILCVLVYNSLHTNERTNECAWYTQITYEAQICIE